MTLAQLPVGATAAIASYPQSGPAFTRLREMGMLPGTRVTLVRIAPLGDPIEIQVRGYRLSLRKSEASLVELAPETPSASA